jgi:hypothetical protein
MRAAGHNILQGRPVNRVSQRINRPYDIVVGWVTNFLCCRGDLIFYFQLSTTAVLRFLMVLSLQSPKDILLPPT